MISRRRFLLSTALGSAAAAGVGVAGVKALKLTTAPKAVGDSYAAAGASCTPVVHDRLRFQLEASLKGKTVTDAELAAMEQANSCPFCGCNLAANQPLPGMDKKPTATN